jgi:hypothetical protein
MVVPLGTVNASLLRSMRRVRSSTGGIGAVRGWTTRIQRRSGLRTSISGCRCDNWIPLWGGLRTSHSTLHVSGSTPEIPANQSSPVIRGEFCVPVAWLTRCSSATSGALARPLGEQAAITPKATPNRTRSVILQRRITTPVTDSVPVVFDLERQHSRRVRFSGWLDESIMMLRNVGDKLLPPGHLVCRCIHSKTHNEPSLDFHGTRWPNANVIWDHGLATSHFLKNWPRGPMREGSIFVGHTQST